MGCITGCEVKLDIVPEARPIKQKLRPVAIHLQESVKRELEKQVDEDILEKVDSLMGPTPWILNLVVVPKGDKKQDTKSSPDQFDNRLTCDARPMNKALRRTRHPTKSSEDLIYLVCAEGIKPTDDKCQALREATTPSNVKELRSLLNVILSNSRFIRDTCSTTEMGF
ncbi:unnamed protein product [Brachionus calyciflorus]|uniref:Uncharacterized protein n=1 Tax=Brachionus calyciflorus TaxID=104777 RepID=A0A813WVC8_9BILA|nr:unnamed protein product [Brachionus calyciflorus]